MSIPTNFFAKINSVLTDIGSVFAPLASPIFTGTPKAPDAGLTTSSQIATVGYVKNQGYITSSSLPSLDAYAKINSQAFTGTPTAPDAGLTTSSQIATTGYVSKFFATLTDPTFAGTPKAPTPATTDKSTQIATTEFVKNQSYATQTWVTNNGYLTSTITASSITVNDGSGTNKTFSDYIKSLMSSGGLHICFDDGNIRSGRTIPQTGYWELLVLVKGGINHSLQLFNVLLYDTGMVTTQGSANALSTIATITNNPRVILYLTQGTYLDWASSWSVAFTATLTYLGST
jgi:hypothetical protein